MEDPIGKGLDGIAGIVAKKWYAAMGLVGMIMFASSWFVEIQGDAVIVRSVALMMFGWGFGLQECRTFRERIGQGFKITGPAWRWTATGALAFAIAISAAIWMAWHILN